MITLGASKSERNLYTLHVNQFKDETCGELVTSASKSGLSISEFTILFHLVAECLQQQATFQALTSWDNLVPFNSKHVALGLAGGNKQLYKVEFGTKKPKVELLSAEPRRYILLDFAHHAQTTFFTNF